MWWSTRPALARTVARCNEGLIRPFTLRFAGKPHEYAVCRHHMSSVPATAVASFDDVTGLTGAKLANDCGGSLDPWRGVRWPRIGPPPPGSRRPGGRSALWRQHAGAGDCLVAIDPEPQLLIADALMPTAVDDPVRLEANRVRYALREGDAAILVRCSTSNTTTLVIGPSGQETSSCAASRAPSPDQRRELASISSGPLSGSPSSSSWPYCGLPMRISSG